MFRPVLIHLLCICIGADSVDSADSTFSVTGGWLESEARAVARWRGLGKNGTEVECF